jgi:hypothetical protein
MSIDYERMQRTFPIHKKALDDAVKSGDVDKVREACRAAITEWDEIGAWPDDWSRWERALNDMLPWNAGESLESLRPRLSFPIPAEQPDTDETYIVVTGNPVDGFEFIGPFESNTAAIEHGENNCNGVGDWYIAPIQTP